MNGNRKIAPEENCFTVRVSFGVGGGGGGSLPRGLLSQNHHERRDTLTGTIFNYSSLVTFLFFNKNTYFIYRTVKKI